MYAKSHSILVIEMKGGDAVDEYDNDKENTKTNQQWQTGMKSNIDSTSWIYAYVA